MMRVHVFVEGQTEETFVKELLYGYFLRKNIYLNPILLKTSETGKRLTGVDLKKLKNLHPLAGKESMVRYLHYNYWLGTRNDG
jgi:hypothetical protein